VIVDAGTITTRLDLRADVVIVGTGAGGAPAARELAEAGASVIMLEEGAHHPTSTLTARPRESLMTLYRDAGQIATIGDPPIVLPLGRAVGGTTLVNSGT
jgi:choline dehydrogenase-like flavoprotein